MKKKEELKEKIKINPYEPCGTVAAQSMGEPGTQMTMRTFHYAGVAEHVPTGLPRLIELLDAKREPNKKVLKIRLKAPYNKSEEKAKQLAKEVEEVLIKDIAKVVENLKKGAIMIKLKKSEMKGKDIKKADVLKILKKYSEKYRIKHKGEKILLKKKEIKSYLEVRNDKENIEKERIKGVAGVRRAVAVKEGKEWIISAASDNIEGVLKLDWVDKKRVFTNNIWKIYELFGIEAARNALLREMKDVMDMQKLYVDIRHMMLVADAMCRSGTIKAIGRFGLSGEKFGVLARAAFEETIKHLFSAAIKNETDKLIGVTECVLIGQPIKMGTGKVKIAYKR